MSQSGARRVACALCAVMMMIASFGAYADDCEHLHTSWKAKTDEDMNKCLFTHYCDDCGHYFSETRTIHYRAVATRIDGEPYEAPTCVSEGYQWAICGQCGAKWKMPLYKTDHTFDADVIQPTCTEKGYTLKTCTGCGETEKTDYTDALGHMFRWNLIAPTCAAGGYKEYVCQRCQASYTADATDALGHLWSDPDRDGVRVCLRDGCGETLQPAWVKTAGKSGTEVLVRVDPVDGCLYIKAPMPENDESACVVAHGETDLSLSITTDGGLFTLSAHAQSEDALGFSAQSDDDDTTRLTLKRNDQPMEIKSASAEGGLLVITFADGSQCTLKSDLAEYAVEEQPKAEETQKPITIIMTTKEITRDEEEKPKIEISFAYKDIVSDDEQQEETMPSAADVLIEAFPSETSGSVGQIDDWIIEPFIQAPVIEETLPAEDENNQEDEAQPEETPEKEFHFLDEKKCAQHGDWVKISSESHECGRCHGYAEPHRWNAFLKFFGKKRCRICQ